jgi:hypothetical protein
MVVPPDAVGAQPARPSRTPPISVIRQLRYEVGFRCPLDGCGNPYLTWHHFDPPWRIEHHHRPDGMIALCREHADKADNGAFTDDQLRVLKREGRDRARTIAGRFDWMRRELLAVVGGNFYLKTDVILQLGDRPCIWFTRNEDGELNLNFWMPSSSGLARAQILENTWFVPPHAANVDCPPNGRRLHVHYADGDELSVEYFDLADPAAFDARYPGTRWAADISFPITGVEIWETAPGTGIEFGPQETRIGNIMMTGSMMSGGVAIRADLPPGVGGRIFRRQELHLAELVVPDQPLLERARFEECVLYGPAILLLVDGTTLSPTCDLGPHPDAVFWPIPPRLRGTGGAILASGCLFDACTFLGVGVAVPPGDYFGPAPSSGPEEGGEEGPSSSG